MPSNGQVRGVRVSGVGAEVPPRVVTTAEVEERAGIGRFGFEAGWLERVTGVRERRWAAPEVQPSHLAAAAGQKALAAAGVDREVRGRPDASDHAPVWIEIR